MEHIDSECSNNNDDKVLQPYAPELGKLSMLGHTESTASDSQSPEEEPMPWEPTRVSAFGPDIYGNFHV